MDNLLRQFYMNESERKAVQLFLESVLKELAGEYALDGKSTDGFKQANETISKMFDILENKYGTIKKPEPKNAR